MTLGDLVKEYREKHNISMDEFSKICGLSKGYISMLENNINPRNNKPIAPTLPTIRKIASAMNADVDSLLKVLDSDQEINLDSNNPFQDYVEPSQITNDITLPEFEHIKKYRCLDDHGQKVVDFILNEEWERSTATQQPDVRSTIHNTPMRLINYYYRLASAGTGQIIFDMPPTKRIEIPNIPEYRKADYAIGVNGNSMEPTFHDGDTLLIEMVDEIESGEIGIFMVDNESYVKKLGKEELISLNMECKNIPLTENSKCMGRVIGKLDASLSA